MADVLDRIKKLMELALHNPNEQEARTAAMAAVRLIDQHKMLRAAVPKPTAVNPLDAFSDLMRQAQEQVERDMATVRVKPPAAYAAPHECRFHYNIVTAQYFCTVCGKTASETEWYSRAGI